MADASGRIPLTGSKRTPLPGARRVAAAPADQPVSVTVLVRRRPDAPPRRSAAEVASQPPAAQQRLSRAEFAQQHGAAAEDLNIVAGFAADHGLDVVESDQARRTVVLSGPVEAVSRAFAVDLGNYERDDLTYRGREGEIQLPRELAEIVEGVFGLDNRPAAGPRIRRRKLDPDEAKPFEPPQVAELYSFPSGGAAGECVGIIELGGGYHDAELDTYFDDLGVPRPTVVSVPIGAGANSPGGDADGEVLLDIEVVGAVAAGVQIAVYFAENTDEGFLNAITTALHDTTHNPSAISISWGAAESQWTAQALRSFDDAFADAATLGVTVLAAAGDHGAADGAGDGKVHADFPASSPHVLGCGGTRLEGTATSIGSEVAWNDQDGWATGGGVSDVFDVPEWQSQANVPRSLNSDHRVGRGVPDVAGNADSVSGYVVLVDGQREPIGGTSAVAPLYAALSAILTKQLGTPVGYVNPLLYPLADDRGVFRDITEGDNSVPHSDYGPATPGYSAGPGWDACTGLGSINGQGLLHALTTAGG